MVYLCVCVGGGGVFKGQLISLDNFKLENGTQIQFWEDKWLGINPSLEIQISQSIQFSAQETSNCGESV
jgi:high-affinity Fe2+/Pb2+ permease